MKHPVCIFDVFRLEFDSQDVDEDDPDLKELNNGNTLQHNYLKKNNKTSVDG